MNAKEFFRFLCYVDVVRNGRWICWEWQGKKCHRGYGRYWWRGQWRQAHRFSFQWMSKRWTLLRVPREIPESAPQLNHRCCNRACVRPSHLEPVTHKENHEYRAMVYWRNKTITEGGR